MQKKGFEQELKMMKLIAEREEKNLVKILDVIDDRLIVMDYCNRGDLYSYFIQNAPPITLPNQALFAIYIAKQIVAGMITLSSYNISHRDLKPENIFIHKEDEVEQEKRRKKSSNIISQLEQQDNDINFILSMSNDFEIKTNICQSQNNAISQSENDIYEEVIVKIGDYGLSKENNRLKSVIGTSNYMAPEILDNKRRLDQENYDNSVDIWSFGLILYEMFTKKQLFESSNANLIFQSILNFNPSLYDNKITSEFRKVQDIILECINPIASKRPNFRQIYCQLQIAQNQIISSHKNNIIAKPIVLPQFKSRKVYQDQEIGQQEQQQQKQQQQNKQQQYDSQQIFKQEQKQQQCFQDKQNFQNVIKSDEYQFMQNLIEKQQSSLELINLKGYTEYCLDEIQMKLIRKIKKNGMEEVVYGENIYRIDEQVFKGIIVNDEIIGSLSFIIIQNIMKNVNIKQLQIIYSYIEQTNLDSFSTPHLSFPPTHSKIIRYFSLKIIENLIQELQNIQLFPPQKNLIVQLLLKLFYQQQSASIIFLVTLIYLETLLKNQIVLKDNCEENKKQNYEQNKIRENKKQQIFNLQNVDYLIENETNLELSHNLSLCFTTDYLSYKPNKSTNDIIISKSHSSLKKYIILITKSTYNILF